MYSPGSSYACIVSVADEAVLVVSLGGGSNDIERGSSNNYPYRTRILRLKNLQSDASVENLEEFSFSVALSVALSVSPSVRPSPSIPLLLSLPHFLSRHDNQVH